MGSTRSSSGVSATQSERVRSRLRGNLRDIKIKIPVASGPRPTGSERAIANGAGT